jgi:2-polyprenyl-3-methyl-5-hydroxy-6-metoxy-1,4-benzoquinol methylase
MKCPLCESHQTTLYLQHLGLKRDYWKCHFCQLTFVPPPYRLSYEEERIHYDTHENEINDPGYRAYLSKISKELIPRLTKGMHGLDYGCGPGPALAEMFKEEGFRMEIYDPLYYPLETPFKGEYDFITCTEVIEHMHQPALELQKLFSLIKKGGWLGAMTQEPPEELEEFKSWHYQRDPTHVCFYRKETMEWVAERFQSKLIYPKKSVFLLQKSP